MNTQEARISGEDAYYAGKPHTANPFGPSDDHHLSWNDGYNQAQEQDDLELDADEGTL